MEALSRSMGNVSFGKLSKAELQHFLDELQSGRSNCTFVIEGADIHTRREILMHHSPVFERMFCGDFSESNVITDISAKEFREMLLYLYEGAVEFDSVEHAWNLFYVAHKYLLGELEDVCMRYIVLNNSLGSLLLSYEYAEMYGLEKIRIRCLGDLTLYLKGIFEMGSSEYHMKVSTLLTLLQVKYLQSSDKDLALGVLKWAVDECGIRKIDPIPSNVIQLLFDLNIAIYLMGLRLEELPEKADDELSAAYRLLAKLSDPDCDNAKVYYKNHWCTFCRSRETYKIAERVKLKDCSYELSTSVCATKSVALFGVLVMSEDSSSISDPAAEKETYKGQITISISDPTKPEATPKVFIHQDSFPYGTSTYVPLDHVVVLERLKNYTIKVHYRNFDAEQDETQAASSVLTYFMAHQLVVPNRAVTFKFNELNGTVVHGLSFYPV